MKTTNFYYTILLFLSCSYLLSSCEKKSKEEFTSSRQTEASSTNKSDEMASQDQPKDMEQDAVLDTTKNSNLQEIKPAKSQKKTENVDSLSDLKGLQKQFIRTAQIRGNVKNNVNATENAEFIVKKYGGYVTNSELTNQLSYQQQVEISKDSILETYYEQGETVISAAVPYQNLDSALQQILRLYSKMEYRKVSAEDVSISLLQNRLTSLANYQSQKRIQVATANSNAKLPTIIDAEDAILNRQMSVINQQIENLKLNDRIRFAAIDIRLIKEQEIKKLMRANVSNTVRTPFGYRFSKALGQGGEIFQEIILFFTGAWAIWLFLGVFVMLYVYVIKPFFKKKE
jgi:hypothetical protein